MVQNIYQQLLTVIYIYIYIYIYIVYRVHSCSISTFLNNLQTIIQKFLEHCPIIIMGNFNVDILKNNNQPRKKRTIIFHG
jgi:hypothetical protein